MEQREGGGRKSGSGRETGRRKQNGEGGSARQRWVKKADRARDVEGSQVGRRGAKR